MESSSVTSFHPIVVDSPNVHYSPEEIVAQYHYSRTDVHEADGKLVVKPVNTHYVFKTQRKVPKVGFLQVGWGGNNGSTVTAAIVANREKLSWKTRTGEEKANYFGSLTQASTIRIGAAEGRDIYVPMKNVLPMVEPNDLVLGGWDISKMNLADSLERAKVLEPDLIRQLRPYMETMVPLPAIFDSEFIAANQGQRADNIIPGTKQQAVDQVRNDIRDFKTKTGVDKVIVMWTANSERYTTVEAGVNDTADNLLAAIRDGHKEISPSTLYAVASILEGCTFFNGSPQNTFVPGAVELAIRHKVYIAGDDFKSGQTKMKSVLVDYLVSAGIKVEAMVTYNHLGNNDMKQLTDKVMWRPKEASKSRVIEDIVDSNGQLYAPGERPDHVVVVKYVEFLGDSKRDVSEYSSRVFMSGIHTLIMHNTCLDSLLCAPLMVDLVVLGELLERIAWKTHGSDNWEALHPVLSIMGYYMKLPLVPNGTQVVNALSKQRAAIENLLRACLGLPADNHMLLESKCVAPLT
mmetsp:Transcript_21558/g.37002  ORF Transcript_21558/g.37002 Transcript_21558/m.37002 type:complete len:519 (-) Transcript_21558:133-1689(-)|eukprot:CAMPEP_0196663914 /NCGR_PEP_ID=MMETSP1086-20130531/54797_1 /TAXON_ID=77921 /ORGANISM="Cyanoptyche  gloeocystis , Strain SAG4.97" /LENGTH=518 /DNA_ID=CAMNT_0041999935 /DNA_START=46 /DNA_END=1602 /DNA_ORIENTATION=+